MFYPILYTRGVEERSVIPVGQTRRVDPSRVVCTLPFRVEPQTSARCAGCAGRPVVANSLQVRTRAVEIGECDSRGQNTGSGQPAEPPRETTRTEGKTGSETRARTSVRPSRHGRGRGQIRLYTRATSGRSSRSSVCLPP